MERPPSAHSQRRGGRKRGFNWDNWQPPTTPTVPLDKSAEQSGGLETPPPNLIPQPLTSQIIANHILNLQKLHPSLFQQFNGFGGLLREGKVESPSPNNFTFNPFFHLSSSPQPQQTKGENQESDCGSSTCSHPKSPEMKRSKEEEGLNKAPQFGSTPKDAKYYERRLKNNLAAKKSRDARKLREDQIALRVSRLEQENAILRCQLAMLEKESGALQVYLIQRHQLHLNSPSPSPLAWGQGPLTSSSSPSLPLSPPSSKLMAEKETFHLPHPFNPTLPSFQFFAPK